MSDLLFHLGTKERRGSKPRCHWLTHGPAGEVVARLTALAAPYAAVGEEDRWMPVGFTDPKEAELDKASRLLDQRSRNALRDWWLAPQSKRAKSPNWDIASTCTIDGAPALLLIEAKAHATELEKEAVGKRLKRDASADSHTSHKQIAEAIEAARTGLERATALPWHIRRDDHYQMLNRFAWAWKLTELGVPVVLIYLGFLDAKEMSDQGRPFESHADWEHTVRAHSEPLFPPTVWDHPGRLNGQTFVPLIRSLTVPLSPKATS